MPSQGAGHGFEARRPLWYPGAGIPLTSRRFTVAARRLLPGEVSRRSRGWRTVTWAGGVTGSHATFRPWCPRGREGSTPSLPTMEDWPGAAYWEPVANRTALTRVREFESRILCTGICRCALHGGTRRVRSRRRIRSRKPAAARKGRGGRHLYPPRRAGSSVGSSTWLITRRAVVRVHPGPRHGGIAELVQAPRS